MALTAASHEVCAFHVDRPPWQQRQHLLHPASRGYGHEVKALGVTSPDSISIRVFLSLCKYMQQNNQWNGKLVGGENVAAVTKTISIMINLNICGKIVCGGNGLVY